MDFSSVHGGKINTTTKDNLQQHINAVWIEKKNITQFVITAVH